jgi:hypothetical protein
MEGEKEGNVLFKRKQLFCVEGQRAIYKKNYICILKFINPKKQGRIEDTYTKFNSNELRKQ